MYTITVSKHQTSPDALLWRLREFIQNQLFELSYLFFFDLGRLSCFVHGSWASCLVGCVVSSLKLTLVLRILLLTASCVVVCGYLVRLLLSRTLQLVYFIVVRRSFVNFGITYVRFLTSTGSIMCPCLVRSIATVLLLKLFGRCWC